MHGEYMKIWKESVIACYNAQSLYRRLCMELFGAYGNTKVKYGIFRKEGLLSVFLKCPVFCSILTILGRALT